MKTILLKISLFLFLGMTSLLSYSAVIYVDINATGNDNGNNWINAYNDLQDALAAATSGDDIWVANGIYKPTNTSDRNIFFTIPSGVRLYGGFTGNETNKSQRDWSQNITTLSGNVGVFLTTTDNSKILINISGGSEEILIDGFELRDAYNESGNNFPIFSADEVNFKHCIFKENYSGGLFQFYITSSTVEFKDCLLFHNTCTGNMVEASSAADVTFNNTTWTENTADIIMHSNSDDGLTANNCIGHNNDEFSYNNFEFANNCLFENNTGGIANPINIITNDPFFTDPANEDFSLQDISPAIGFGDNNLTSQGLDLAHNFRISGLDVDLGCYEKRVPTIQYVDVDATGLNNGASWDNAFNLIEDALLAALPGDKIWVAEGIYYALDPNNTDQQFIIPDGVDLKGGFDGTETMGNQTAPIFNPTILSADIGVLGDSNDNSLRILYLENTEIGVTIDGFFLQDINSSESAIHIKTQSLNIISSATIKNCVFRFNSSSFASSCIRSETNNTITGETNFLVENCLFTENSADALVSAGLGINTLSVVGCTFADNIMTNPSVGIIFSGTGSTPSIYNSIFWDNEGNPAFSFGVASDVQYNLFEVGSSDGVYFTEDPDFINPSGLDYRLLPWSPAFGVGANEFVSTNRDLQGNDRIQSVNVDLGCLESSYSIQGCTDNLACNYDSSAEVDDASCTYSGCTDTTANNFDPGAGCDDGSCDFSALTTYVDKDANGANNGSSWANAFTSLQDGIDVTAAGDQVWVAGGTYTTNTNNRNTAIYLKDGVELYGGFSGIETLIDQRNWAQHPTIISGEIGTGAVTDNSLTLLYADSHVNTIILDGFTLRDQYVDNDQSDGVENAPFYVISCDFDIRNCIFTNNYDYQSCAINSNGPFPKDVTISNCLFSDSDCNFSTIIRSDNDLDIYMYNTTIANINHLGSPNGKLFNLFSPSELNMYNSIVYNSGVTDLISDAPDLLLENVILDVDYGEVGSFTNVTIADPNFVLPGSGDFSLSSSSLAINYGNNAQVASSFDLAHNQRIMDGTVDAGCYEFEITTANCDGDANGDGLVNAVDYLAISSFFGCTSGCTTGDANGDGLVNAVDYLSVSSFFGIPCP